MRTKPEALTHDRAQYPPTVAKCPQVALGAGDARMVGSGNLDDPQPSCHGLAGQLGLDLEPRRPQPHKGAIAFAECTVTGKEVGVAWSDQDPEGRADQVVSQSTGQ